MHIVDLSGRDVAALAPCFAVRRKVFCEEQGIAESIEWDGLDTACAHVLLSVEGQPVGTARVRPLGADTVKIERIAVLKDRRTHGHGARLMRHILARADRDGHTAVLNAQTAVRGFYEKLGFVADGPEFEEAGIPHVHMTRPARKAKP
ncbi:MAG: GNAT family N-acetyltransferase [Rhodospirillaceae bacterium]|nr:GNAT family N-acetyltransferase [Rhodospirillaceae bacterium]